MYICCVMHLIIVMQQMFKIIYQLTTIMEHYLQIIQHLSILMQHDIIITSTFYALPLTTTYITVLKKFKLVYERSTNS